MCLSIFSSIHLPIYLSASPPVNLFISLSHLSLCLSVYLSLFLLSTYPYLSLSLSLSSSLSIYPSAYLYLLPSRLPLPPIYLSIYTCFCETCANGRSDSKHAPKACSGQAPASLQLSGDTNSRAAPRFLRLSIFSPHARIFSRVLLSSLVLYLRES